MKDAFQILQPWLSEILHTIKKEIKTEHLSKSPVFYKAHFGNRPLNRLTNEEICSAYEKVLLEDGSEEIGEWVVNRWVFRHGDIYEHFAEGLSQIQDDFSQIESLNEEQSERILKGALEAFSPISVYQFTVLNGVVLAPSALSSLRSKAEQETKKRKQEQQVEEEREGTAKTIEHYQRELARIEKKYEEKLAGVARKHATDVEALKRQVRSLQQRLK